MKITIVAGARPNFMKISPLIRAVNKAQRQGENIEARLIYTGKRKDKSLEESLFEDLDMPQPDNYLEVESNDFCQRLAGIIVAFANELENHPTDLVMVVDDLTPTMACSIVARKKNVKIAHLVAGIRSFDINTPKELNRIITDGLSDILFTASISANRNLNQTGIEQKQIHFVGNILMDTLRYNQKRLIQPKGYGIEELGKEGYLLLTINRHELLKDKNKLEDIIHTILTHTNHPIVAPVHGYVKERLEALDIHSSRIHILPPLPYLEFGYLTSHAKGIITDSGNVAEEATFQGIPCITLNNYTEHNETVTIGTNRLAGDDPQTLAQLLSLMENGQWHKAHLPERWDGRTAERIVQTLLAGGL